MDFAELPFIEIKESKLLGAFRTHMHYLQAFDLLATTGRYKIPEAYSELKSRFLGSTEMPRINFPLRSSTQVRRSLENAWGTELLLYLGHRFLKTDEITRLSNTWNVVQAYYAVYHATQAVIVARGTDRPDSHPKTQRAFVDFWERLPEPFTPWCLSFGWKGHHPSNVVIDCDIHPWKVVDPENCTSLACKALRTTREDVFPERFKAAREAKRRAQRRAWLEEEKGRVAVARRARQEPTFRLPRLTADERTAVERATRNYSMLDYLYRLRLRTNYGDAAVFTDGPDNDRDSKSVRVALIRIVSTSLLAVELVLATAPDGADLLREWSERWIEANVPKEIDYGVRQRVPYW